MSLRARLGLGLVAALAVLLMLLATMRAGSWDSDYATVRARHAAPPSRFIRIDGVDLHIRDEGTGPPVVMLHGSIVNLHEWDAVVERLRSRFRIIRIDWPPYGVSGPDPHGIYTTARAADLLAGLIDRLALPAFSVVATSNGANVALEYNARYPGRIAAMALSVLPLERPSQTRKVDGRIRLLGWLHSQFLPDYHSRYWYRLILEDTSSPGFVPTEEFIDSLYATNNLPGAARRQRAYIDSNTRLFKTTDVGAVAEKVTVPVLLQWCELDTVISQTAERSIARFRNAPVTLIRYPQLGHFPMLEDPELFAADLAKFLRANAPPIDAAATAQ